MKRARKGIKKDNAQPPKKRRLTEFVGIFPATKPYIGVDATRQLVAKQLGEELERKLPRH